MPSEPAYFAQEAESSCAVACLRMVLSAFGIQRSETELCELCDCGWEGTDALRLVDAARQLGLRGTRKYNLSLNELFELIAQGKYPIVYVRTRLDETALPTQHAFVVKETDREILVALDPWLGERKLSTFEFEREWRQMNGLTIICQID